MRQLGFSIYHLMLIETQTGFSHFVYLSGGKSHYVSDIED